MVLLYNHWQLSILAGGHAARSALWFYGCLRKERNIE